MEDQDLLILNNNIINKKESIKEENKEESNPNSNSINLINNQEKIELKRFGHTFTLCKYNINKK